MLCSWRSSPPSVAGPACHGRRLAGPLQQAFASAPPPTGDPAPQAFDLRWPRAFRSRVASVTSERASLEVPGIGAPALPSALRLESLAPAWRSPWIASLPRPAGGGDSASAAAVLQRARCETRPSPPIQRQRKTGTLSPWRGDSLWSLRGAGLEGQISYERLRQKTASPV
jgi:hypothetical protein